MEKISHDSWDEIVFSSSNSKESQAIRRAILAHKLRKLAPRIYTTNLEDTPENIIRRNRYLILGELFPGAILSHRSALEAGVSKNNVIILTFKYTKKIQLPGLTIRLLEGAGAEKDDTPFMGKLYIASRARALLENLQLSRGDIAKTLPRKEIEIYLDKVCRIHGEDELNRLRDQARELAQKINYPKEFKTLEKLIGSILQTHTDYPLQSSVAKARSQGKPYDPARVDIFSDLATRLKTEIIPIIKATENNSLQNLAFFEAYFSNYIEGTEFEVDEAAEIIFQHKAMPGRPEDAHDIISTYQLVSDLKEMQKTPTSVEQLIKILKYRHHTLMSVRQDKHPGEFKMIANRAGDTVFVQPELVVGTLEKGFELYQILEPGIQRAIYMMFLVAEVHPFDDGNGRIARIMMNAELTAANQSRIIIPTVYREDYVLALRRLSRSFDSDAYIKMLLRAEEFTASIDYRDYKSALQQFRNANSFLSPFEGKLQFYTRSGW